MTKDGYIVVQVAEPNKHTGYHNSYQLKHRWIWEQANGPIPENHIISFKNGDKTDCRIDNLELITMAENAIRNKMSYSDLSEEIKTIGSPVSKSIRKTSRTHKNSKNLKDRLTNEHLQSHLHI